MSARVASKSPSKAKKGGSAATPGTTASLSKYLPFGLEPTDFWCKFCAKPVQKSNQLSHVRGAKHTAAMLEIPVSDVARHQLTITTEAKFKCDMCKSGFATIPSMKKHLLTKVHLKNLERFAPDSVSVASSFGSGISMDVSGLAAEFGGLTISHSDQRLVTDDVS